MYCFTDIYSNVSDDKKPRIACAIIDRRETAVNFSYYWKAQHLISKKFLGGYAVNRQHFHAQTAAAIMLAAWSKEEDKGCEELTLKALDLDENEHYVDCGEIQVKKIHSLFSETYYQYGT